MTSSRVRLPRASIGGPRSAGHHVAAFCANATATSGEIRPCYRLAPDDLDTEILLELSML